VINNDYDKNKKGVCGNCKTLATNGLCPFGDIEDAGRLCSEELTKTTGKNQKYPINHPAQYFRRSL
jgi:DNA primase large subunit